MNTHKNEHFTSYSLKRNVFEMWLSINFELIMVKIGILYSVECKWTRAQIDCLLTAVGARNIL